MAIINPHTTRATGTVLTAAIYNADHQNHITNATNLNAEVVASTGADAALGIRMTAAEAALVVFRQSRAGIVEDFAGPAANIPAGSILCFGQAVSRATYALMFTAILTTYGPGDGVTTFNLPDARGRAVAGKDDMGGASADRLTNPGATLGGIDGDVLGGTGGVESHVLLAAQTPAHVHTMPDHQHAAGGLGGTALLAGDHNHGTAGSTPYVSGAALLPTDGQQSITSSTRVTTNAGDHTHALNITGSTALAGAGNTGSIGGGTLHNNVQPTLILNKIIWTGL